MNCESTLRRSIEEELKAVEPVKKVEENPVLFPSTIIPPSQNGTVNEIDVFKKLLPLFQYGLGKGIWKSVEEFIKIDNAEIQRVQELMDNEGKEL